MLIKHTTRQAKHTTHMTVPWIHMMEKNINIYYINEPRFPSIHAFGSVSNTRDILAVSLYTNDPRFPFITAFGSGSHTHGTSWLCLYIQMNYDLLSIHAFGSVSHTRDILAVSLDTNEPRFAFYPCIWFSVTITRHPGCVSIYKRTTICLLPMHLV